MEKIIGLMLKIDSEGWVEKANRSKSNSSDVGCDDCKQELWIHVIFHVVFLSDFRYDTVNFWMKIWDQLLVNGVFSITYSCGSWGHCKHSFLELQCPFHPVLGTDACIPTFWPNSMMYLWIQKTYCSRLSTSCLWLPGVHMGASLCHPGQSHYRKDGSVFIF